MNYELKELNLDMGEKEYEMYQDIPLKESGSTNLCNGLSYEVFKNFLESQMARKYQNISEFDTPTIIYVMYVDNYPVGYIGLRTKLNDNWKKWSGNFYYVIRTSERGKGYASKMLSLLINECKKFGFNEIYGQSSEGNLASSKVIENNGGVLINEIDGTKYYKIML